MGYFGTEAQMRQQQRFAEEAAGAMVAFLAYAGALIDSDVTQNSCDVTQVRRVGRCASVPMYSLLSFVQVIKIACYSKEVLMRKLPVLLHLIGLGMFLGSVACHILISVLARSALEADDLASGVALRAQMIQVTLAITMPGLALMWLSGLWRLRNAPGLLRSGYLRAKLVLVGLATLNGLLVLTPLSYRLSELAREALDRDSLAPSYSELAMGEDVAGALNLLFLLSACALAVYRPGRRRGIQRGVTPEFPRGEAHAR